MARNGNFKGKSHKAKKEWEKVLEARRRPYIEPNFSSILGSQNKFSFFDSQRKLRGEVFWREQAPADFRLIENSEEVLNFFSVFDRALKEKNFVTLFLDLEQVTTLTPETILFLLLKVDEVKKKISLSGNGPADGKCASLFLTSGFYKYVRSDIQHQKNEDIISVIKSKTIERGRALNMQDFAAKHLGPDHDYVTNMFPTLSECMQNSFEHAYLSEGKTLEEAERNWWSLSIVDRGQRVIKTCFLDNGDGIPHTLKASKRVSKSQSDEDILLSALKGETGSRTSEPGRNTGLPQIYRLYLKGKVNNLTIVTNKALIDCKRNKVDKVPNSFPGTLISWEAILP